VDIVLCSTGAHEPVIVPERVHHAMRARKGRWLFFIDIAMPRDVDPRVGEIDNVFLYDVDALEKVVAGNRAGRAREADRAEALVVEEVRRFVASERTQGVVPVIKALRGRFHELARVEAERAVGRLQSASERDRAQVLQLAEAIANKLLHAPLTALKRGAGEGDEALAEALRVLFELHEEPEEDLVPLKTKEGA
jgi:glutamyl-tRNA reductase